jgi:hypothetical protein
MIMASLHGGQGVRFWPFNMKAPWIVVVAAVVLCGAAIAFTWNKDAGNAANLEKQIADLQAQNAKLTADLADANDRAKMLASESAQLRAAQQTVQPAAAPVAAATPEQPKPKGNNFLTQMLKDPSMRKAIASQQAAALRGFYSDFVKQAHLSPDQADQFFKLLGDRMTTQMDLGANMLSGSGSAANIVSATNDSNAAMKDLLGADGFSSFETYEKSLGSRIQVQQLGQQLSSEGIGLQDYQNTALTQIMTEEQSAMPKFNTPGANQQLSTMSDAQVDQYQQQLQTADQQIYNRAMSVLTPPQLSALSTYQKNMETAQIAGMKMAKSMFNSGQ